MKSFFIFFGRIFSIVLIISQVSQAAPTPRFSGALGIGQSTVASAEGGSSRVENPIGLGFFIDYPYKGSYYLYAEHMRSMSGSSTGVGLTGVGLKFYPWLSPAHFKSTNGGDVIASKTIQQSGYAFYLGGSGGFSQASVPSKASVGLNAALAAGLSINGKAGAEFPMTPNWGFKGEGNFSMSMAGAGSISHFNMIFGAYFDL